MQWQKVTQGKGLRSAGPRGDCKFKRVVRAGSTERVTLEQRLKRGKRASRGDLCEKCPKQRESCKCSDEGGGKMGMCMTGTEFTMERENSNT